jgi:AcrR family transcriptional regulator
MRPPPGRHPLPREFIAQHQRARIISALAEEAAEKGYRAVTVADVVRRARIARNTFYENFACKEECFLAASEFAVEEALHRVVEAAGEVESWADRVDVGLAAFLSYVASEPALARMCILEALTAGPAAVERYERAIGAFVPLFRLGRRISPNGKDLPETLEETIVGGIFWILYQRVVTGQVEQIEELRPELVEFSLAPYAGAAAARRTASESAR